mgnify:FL=1
MSLLCAQHTPAAFKHSLGAYILLLCSTTVKDLVHGQFLLLLYDTNEESLLLSLPDLYLEEVGR